MPKIVDYEKKRQEIIEKAIQVFIRDGYYLTNLSSIAKECGMGRTTLYQYFRNKEEIFLYSVRNVFDAITVDYRQVIEKPNLSFLEKIKEVFAILSSHYKEDKGKMLIVSELSLIIQRHNFKDIEIEKNKFISKLANKFKFLLEQGIKSKEIKEIDTDTMAYTLYTLVKSLIFQPSISSDIAIEEYLYNIQ